MPDANSGERRVRSLVMEALLLSEQVSAMDRRIQQATSSPRSELLEFLAHKGVDWAARKGLEEVFGRLLAAIFRSVSIPSRTFVGLLHSSRQPSARMAYLDARPELASAYESKTRRLAQIYLEMFTSTPPAWQSMKMDNLCAREACFRSGGALK